MLFTYIARDKNSKEITGKISATSKLDAADKLFQEKQLSVIKIEGIDEKSSSPEKKEEESPTTIVKETKETEKIDNTKIHIGQSKEIETSNSKASKKQKNRSFKDLFSMMNDFLIQQTKITSKEKAIMFRLIAVMIGAGLPIVKALKTLSKQTANKRLQVVLSEIASNVEEGSNFSKALAEYDDIFTEAEIGMISAGEASGQLNKTLANLATEAEKSANLKNKIKSAMIYPIVVLTILIGAVILVMTLVVPKLSELFTSNDVELPISTKILVGGSDWFISSWFIVPNWLLVVLLIICAVVGIKSWKKTKIGLVMWDNLMLNIPIFGQLNRKAALASFARQLSLLSESGVPIIRALEITAKAVGNEIYKERLLEIREEVENGLPIYKVIKNDDLFPGLVVNMIAVGEQTAQLGSVADKIAIFYDDEIDTFVKNLSSIMEPVIIVVIGTLVAGLVASIMQPIMQISDIAATA